jgi:hypothetical protein
VSSYTPHAKIRPSIALSAALLALATGCSGASPTPGESTSLDMDADPPVATDDGSNADPPAGDASTSLDADVASDDAGTSGGHDAGTTTAHDAGTATGTVHVSCSELQLGVCQNATLSASKEASWRAQCKMQGGTADPCPTTNVVGCCVGDTAHYCYYAPDYDVSMAQEGCSIMNGTWSPTM